MAMTVFINSFEPAIGGSKFENAIDGLNPLAWYRFRDASFATQVLDSSGNGYHLTKQIATATRSAVKTRTTHPGGAYFPAVTYDNWATTGTFYKGTTGLLNGTAAYTLVVSMRMLQRHSAASHKLFGVGTEDVAESGTNDLAIMLDGYTAHRAQTKRRSALPSLITVNTDVTEFVEDGVNRLYITRFTAGSVFALKTSKPGYIELAEATADNSTNLDALSKALILNARLDTTGSAVNTTTGWVVDQIALWASDIGATAATSLHTLWAAELAGYYPSMMQFDGSTGYYLDTSVTTSGNADTLVVRINTATFTGGGSRMVAQLRGPVFARILIRVVASDNATTAARNLVVGIVFNNVNAVVARIYSTTNVCNSADHIIHFKYDGTAGTATLSVNEVAEDNMDGTLTRVAPTTATLSAGALSIFSVGATDSGTDFFPGKIGLVGSANTSATSASSFSTGNLPKAISESAWTEWGAQPLFWSHTGQMNNNKGSAGDMTANGTITMTTGGSP